MKTIKTEKHNIPEGATHYINESCVHRFSWGKYVGDDLHLRLSGDEGWTCVENKFFSGVVDEIPQEENQMNIDNLATQTPEEKEALDSIKSVHLRDYQKADKSHTKVEYEKVTESIFDLREEFERGELHYDFGDEDWFTFNDEASLVAGFKEGNVYRRIEITETPQQREERERLEAAEDLYITYMSKWEFAQDWRALDEINKSAFLAIVDKTNYRKESN